MYTTYGICQKIIENTASLKTSTVLKKKKQHFVIITLKQSLLLVILLLVQELMGKMELVYGSWDLTADL